MKTKNEIVPIVSKSGQHNLSTSGHSSKALAPSTFLEQALAYVARGWFVFPLKPGTKNPLTKHGFKDASNDPKQIRDWWAKTPQANIGLDCGRSNVLVIDVDGDEGLETLGDLEIARGLVYHTLTASEIDRYTQTAFDNEINKLSTTPDGDRNNQLNRSARALGQFIGAGVFDRSTATNLPAAGPSVERVSGHVCY